jgi:solute carrier family 34 (sodium-dependent phosphate cotransporter)
MDESTDTQVAITSPLQGKYSPKTLELPASQPGLALEDAREIAWWKRISVYKITLFITSLFLFVLAITLMKDGARGLAPHLRSTFSNNSTANSLGFGWFFAYIIMSGSPVAAASLTFFDAGVIDNLGSFAMITGSRLGASFIVLFIGFLYVLRGRDRSTSLSMGLVSLIVTATTYIPAFILGVFFLNTGWFDSLQPQSGALLYSIIDMAIMPLAGMIAKLLPDWLIFFVGLGIILLSFNLFDKCLPQMTLKSSQVGRMSRLVYRPIVMFLLGALVTMVSMSVSLSLSILVPLSARGFVRRENVIPYIMGANITTFVDTLLAAVLLQNSAAFTIIFVEMLSILIISAVILLTTYRPYHTAILKRVAWITANNRNLAIFMVSILVIPIILMLIQ